MFESRGVQVYITVDMVHYIFRKGWFDSRLVLYVNLYMFLLLVISVIFSVFK